MQRRHQSLLIAATLGGLVASTGAFLRAEEAPNVVAKFSSEQIVFFESQVRPLLVERCGKCHGAAKQQGGLRLDSREAILTGGDLGTAATPGEPAASLLIEVVGYAGDLKMPPSGKLSDGEIATLTRWVRDGLAWPAGDAKAAPANATTSAANSATAQHPLPWSFVPVAEPAEPKVQKSDWCRGPLDRFVLSRLEQAQLQPAPEADKRTLIRRAKFDLLGLPPTPQEIDAFLADNSADAFAQLVDRYLASPEYGQRWGRHWLDVARYADSNGQDENLAYVNAFRYRDYVVDAFNSDKPYDAFVREQIAGDLLPESAGSGISTGDVSKSADQRRFERLVATGFLTLGPKMLAEDDPVKMEMDIVDEQLDAVGSAFLGLTLGCARCHDHKFDPISTADYYALAGIFKSTRTMDNFKVVAQWHERPLGTAAEIAAIAEHAARVAEKKKELADRVEVANRALIDSVRNRSADYLLAATELLAAPPLTSLLQAAEQGPTPAPPDKTVFVEAEQFARGNVLVDTTSYGAGIGVILNRGELPNYTEYDVELPTAGSYQLEIRYAAAEARSVQLLIDGKLRKQEAAGEVTGSWNPDTQRWMPEGVFQLPAGKIVLRIERAAGPIPHLDRIALIPVTGGEENTPRLAVTAEELATARGLHAPFIRQWADYLKSEQSKVDSIWQLWIAFTRPDFDVASVSDMVRSKASHLLEPSVPATTIDLAARYQAEILATAASAGGPFSDLAQGPLKIIAKPEGFYTEDDRQQIAALTAQFDELTKSAPPALPQAMAVEEGTPTDLKIHIRGSHLTLGETSPRGFPRALSTEASTIASGASGRLELANWMTSKDHPLTARVLVNRLWRWHFGAGLVRSTDNFGNLGDAPSHPELLDWLARRLVDSGWSVKAMHRLIMGSATYQMSTRFDPVAAEADPDNRLLWRMNRRRLEAEAVRDSLLFVGGKLDTSLGGSLLQNKAREYVAGTASVNSTNYQTNRRSLYLPVVRSALYDPFQAFDFAEPTMIKGDRESTTIASQALFMMNSDEMHEQSAALANLLLDLPNADDQQRVAALYARVLGRPATEREVERALSFVGQVMATYTFQHLSERELPAWGALCRVLMSSNEFLYVE